MIRPHLTQFQLFGLAVALAFEASVKGELPSVTAEELWLAEGRGAQFGHPLACGRLPVVVAGQSCLCAMHEARRYRDEFLPLPGAL